MSRTSSLDDLLDLLEPSGPANAVANAEAPLVLLPTSRAASELRSAFDARQHARGQHAWEPPPVLSWTQWANSLWSELIVSGAEPRLLLNAAQEHSLWREIVAASPAASPAASTLASPDSLADLARSAWQVAAAHEATQRLRASATTHDCRLFADWAAAFLRLCGERGYLSPALLDAALRRHLESGALTPPRSLHLAGFSELTPAQKSLLATLSGRGAEVVHHTLAVQRPARSDEPPLRAFTVAATERDELFLAARWIRLFLEDHAAPSEANEEGTNENGANQGRGPRVAVLLPDLSADRADVEAVFREILAPELQSITADLSSGPWETAGGPPLGSVPVIAAALDLARWATAALPLERVSSLLLSSYLGDDLGSGLGGGLGEDDAIAQHEAIAQFDVRVLRRARLLRPEIALATVAALLEGPKARALSPDQRPPLRWPRHLQVFLDRSGSLSRPRSFADWTEFLREMLRTINWPSAGHANTISAPRADQAFTTHERAAVEAWESALDLIATLDFSGRRVPFSIALDALERQLRTTPFHSPPTHAPVQVMAVADSAGCCFDATIFLRATDANWPPPGRANPLLAWPLQRSLRMPGTDPAQTTARARDVTAGLLARSRTVLFTHAAEDADGPLRGSPLLGELALQELRPSELVPAPLPPAPIVCESFVDDSPLPALPAQQVHGGAHLLKLQAACGFQAFAELRLRATEPEHAEIGLDAPQSGTVLHRALQSFWSVVRTQKALRAMPSPQRAALLARCIDEALPRGTGPASPWDAAYLALQKDRQLSILQQWLEEELQRGPFAVVGLEEQQHITVGPLTLSVRMDRIDRVGHELDADEGEAGEAGEDSGFFFVDYKTGNAANPRQWEGDRPDEPQLPLYALLPEPGELKGIAFARVRAGKDMRWLGLQDAPGILPGPPGKQRGNVVDLPALIDHWRNTLGQLAEDFAAGRAVVDPKSYPQTCDHCAQRLLCRVNPALLPGTLSDEGANPSMATDASEDGDG